MPRVASRPAIQSRDAKARDLSKPLPKQPSKTKDNFYSDIITDLADREAYPGELGGAKLKTTKARSMRPPIKAKEKKQPAAPSKWLSRLRL